MKSFTLLSALAAVATGPFFARAAPTDANLGLARKYAPQYRFEKNERYWGSSVDYFLAGPITPRSADGTVIATNAPLSTTTVSGLPNQGADVFLSVDINDESKAGFLAGQDPSKSDGAKIYSFIVPKDNGVVDLFYWLFTPYNFGKKVPLLGQVGDHVGDWERITVRTVNGTAVSVDYHAHGDTGSGTVPWDKAPKFDNDNRPVAYIASGSHGMWSSAGTFTYVNAVIFKLQDITSEGGVAWDTQNSLVPVNYPDQYSGALDWLNYKGRWGNKGTDTCWWHIFYKDCEVVDAPGGPVRDNELSTPFAKGKAGAANFATVAKKLQGEMSKAASHTLATVSSGHSSRYTIYTAGANTSGFVGVKQTCSAATDGNAAHFTKHIDVQEDGTVARRAEPETVSRFAVVPAGAQLTVSVGACPEGTAIQSYSVASCSASTVWSCTFSNASARLVRAYSKDAATLDVQLARAVDATDLDTWEL